MFQSGGQIILIRIVSLALQFLLVFSINHISGESVYGLFVRFLMYTQIVGTVATLGLDTFLMKKLGVHHQSKSDFNTHLIVFSLLGMLMGALITAIIVPLIQQVSSNYLAPIPLWMYIVGTMGYCLSRFVIEYLRGRRKIEFSAVASYFLIPFLSVLLIWLFLPNDKSIYQLVLLYLIVYGIIYLPLMLFLNFRGSSMRDFDFSLGSIKNVLWQSSPFFLATVFIYLNEWVDKLVLNSFVAEETLGGYYVAFRLSLFISLPLMAFNMLLAPVIAEHFHKKEYSIVRERITSVLYWAFGMAVLGYLSYVLLGKYLLGIFSPTYKVMYPALLILGLGQLVNVAAGPVGVTMKMTSLSGLYAKLALVSVMVNVVLGLILIPGLQTIGSAIAQAVGVSVINIISVIYCLKKIKLNTTILPRLGKIKS